MALAVWIVVAWILAVYLGTWAIQIAVGLIRMGVMIALGLGMAVFGLLSLAVLAVADRPRLMRVLREARA